MIREKKERIEAAALRDAIRQGYRDLLKGRVIEFNGDLRATLKEGQRREKEDWSKGRRTR